MQKRLLNTVYLLTLIVIILEFFAGVYVKNTKLDKKLNYIKEKIGHYDQFTVVCYDDYLGYTLRPSVRNQVFTSEFEVVYSINSHGLRDQEISLNKPGEEFRIIAMGESNVFGQGIIYGKRFTEVIEHSLNKVCVINMGVPGFGLDQSILQLQRDGFQFNPNLVILFIIEDYLQRCKYYEYSPGLKPRFVVDNKGNNLILEEIESAKSKVNYKITGAGPRYLLHLNKTNVFDSFNILIIFNYYLKIKDINVRIKEQDRAYYRKQFDNIARFKLGSKKNNGDEFGRLIFLLLRKIKALCDEYNTPLLVVNIWQSALDNISNSCNVLRIPYLDLSDTLGIASRRLRLQFEIDPHYNEFAHKLIGEYVSSYLRDNYRLEKNRNYTYEYLGQF